MTRSGTSTAPQRIIPTSAGYARTVGKSGYIIAHDRPQPQTAAYGGGLVW
jgi:hypothetical protein